jgi:hypothetical protein
MSVSKVVNPAPTPSPVVPPRQTPAGERDFHVIPFGGGWAVKPEFSDQYIGLWDTQIEAMAFGMRQARDSASALIVHGLDGRFREVRNYS